TRASRKDEDEDKSGVGPRVRTGGTTLYDSVFLASDELMSRQKGRKALIILTDGDDRSSKETLASAIEAAQHADTIIYAIYFKGGRTGQQNSPIRRSGGYPGGGYPGGGYPGGGYPGGGYPGGGYPGGGYPGGGYPGGGYPGDSYPDGTRPPPPRNDSKNVLNRMTKETGGRVFEVSKKQPIADIYTEIGKELRAQYRLGYTPTDSISGDGYHQVDLYSSGPDKKKYTIQTRDGYFTGK
ncbi:MAG: VWA domain-containing protein, partial [Granulicella sp.]